MSRLSSLFQVLRREKRRAVIPYIVAGDPTPEGTVPLLQKLVDAGADILELGVPFSDPMSEGPVIQKGHERALANGISLQRVLEFVSEFRRENYNTPIVLMGYVNPIERFGYRAFAAACSDVGVDGLITVDLPPEEVDTMDTVLKEVNLDNIFLISPTTPEQRIQKIADRASGFIYYVSVKGVTGAGHLDTREVAERIRIIRSKSDLPVAVGFGIKDPDSAKEVAEVADAVVIGSALIDAMATISTVNGSVSSETQRHAAAVKLLQDIRNGVDSLPS